MIEVRPARPEDADEMANILNEIIRTGGTTAITKEVNAADLLGWQDRGGERSAWHVAIYDGQVIGFQWINATDYLPTDAAEIATFAKQGQTKRGVGSALFDATQAAARSLGFGWINADIRSDNIGGLRYYDSRGFYDYGHKSGVEIGNGLTVHKTLKRFDL